MFSKENVKSATWSALVAAIVSVVMWVGTYLNKGGGDDKPKPPIPVPVPVEPSEQNPIVVNSDGYPCEPGSTVLISPKFIGQIKWSVPPMFENRLKIYPFEDKAIVNINSGATGTFYVAINGAFTKDGKSVPSGVVYVKIPTSQSPEPNPNPNPKPVPPPPPVFPDGKYKLAQFTYNSVITNVPAEYQKGPSAEFANNYSGISSKIVAGGFNGYTGSTMIQAILKDTTSANQDSLKNLKVDPKHWDTFFVSLQDELWGKYQGKTLNTQEEFATAWNEIAVGFKAVSK